MARSTGQAASITSTLKHTPSSSSRTFDTPSTLVAQLPSHGIYSKDEKMFLNIAGRQSPQSMGGLKRTAVRPEPGRKKSSADSNLVANRKIALSNQHSMASSVESPFPEERRGRSSPSVVAVARQKGATRMPAAPPANGLNLDIQVSRQSKPLPPVEPRAIFAEVLSASPSSMATSELPVYSSDEESSIRRRPRTGRPACRTPSFGSRRQGLLVEPNPDSSSSESDTDSIAKSRDSVSTGHSASTDNRTSRYARLLVAIGI